jgi:uncharacterized protein (DUF433 family)/DNA-binding transcriptional MerR regulator
MNHMGGPNPAPAEVLAFSAEQVCQLTGLSLRQVRYWDDTEFFSPEYAPGYRRAAYSRVYSFRDVVGLSTIGLLRKRVPLQTLRQVGGYLRRYHDTPWASLALYVRGREVVFRDPDNPDVFMSAVSPGQNVFPIELLVIARKVGERAQILKARRDDQMGKVRRHRFVVQNKPVLAGTRVPTAAVWNLHEAGYSAHRIIAEFPRLGPQDVKAAIQYERKRRRKKVG